MGGNCQKERRRTHEGKQKMNRRVLKRGYKGTECAYKRGVAIKRDRNVHKRGDINRERARIHEGKGTQGKIDKKQHF